jgi:hypothetical protein
MRPETVRWGTPQPYLKKKKIPFWERRIPQDNREMRPETTRWGTPQPDLS